METTLSLAIGFVLGILSCAIFWYSLLLVKPNIDISRHAALDPQTNRLRIKVINRSRRYAKDITANLLICDRYLEGDVYTIGVLKQLRLKTSSLSALAPIQDLHKPWSPPTVYVFSTEPLTDELSLLLSAGKGEKRIEFTLQATDALSNTTIVRVVTYRPDDIKCGGFLDSMSLLANGIPIDQDRPSGPPLQ